MKHKSVIHFFILLVISIPFSVYASELPFEVIWERQITGELDDAGQAISATSDGGAILAGERISLGRNIFNSAWVGKINSDGSLQWETILKHGEHIEGYLEMLQSITVLPDQSMLAVGEVSPPSLGNSWVIKISKTGKKVWSKIVNGRNNAYLAVAATPSGSAVIGGNVTASKGGVDLIVKKITNSGTLEWEKQLSTEHWDEVRSIKVLKDGSILVVGFVSGVNKGEVWLIKLSPEGNLLWDRRIGLSKYQYARDIALSADGNVFLVGYIKSQDTAKESYKVQLEMDSDMWVVKTDKHGSVLWQKRFGGLRKDEGRAIVPLRDGGALLVGTLHSGDSMNAWLVRVNKEGQQLWQKKLCVLSFCQAMDAAVLTDGNVIITGGVNSAFESRTYYLGPSDIWMAKIKIPEILKLD